MPTAPQRSLSAVTGQKVEAQSSPQVGSAGSKKWATEANTRGKTVKGIRGPLGRSEMTARSYTKRTKLHGW